MDEIFEIKGYHIEVFEGKKYLGYIPVNEPDRETMGYEGRREMEINGNLQKGHNTFYVSGTYMTECVPICGKIKKDKIEVLRRSQDWKNHQFL